MLPVEILVHPRIMEKHPEISENDVICAWNNFARMQHRSEPNSKHAAAVGFDGKGRLLEMVAVFDGKDYLVYHAMTPPTKKMLAELGINRR